MRSKIIERDVTTIYNAYCRCDKPKLLSALIHSYEVSVASESEGNHDVLAISSQLSSFMRLLEDAEFSFRYVSGKVVVPWADPERQSIGSSSLERVLGTRIALPPTLTISEQYSLIAEYLFNSIRFAFS